jgi:hypothetical protein
MRSVTVPTVLNIHKLLLISLLEASDQKWILNEILNVRKIVPSPRRSDWGTLLIAFSERVDAAIKGPAEIQDSLTTLMQQQTRLKSAKAITFLVILALTFVFKDILSSNQKNLVDPLGNAFPVTSPHRSQHFRDL